MLKTGSNFYGMMLLVILTVMLIGLYTAEPKTTGFVVREAQDNSFFDVKTFPDDPRTCTDGSLNGECSSLIKPKFCLYGTLVDYCELCGCDAGEVCQNRECAKV